MKTAVIGAVEYTISPTEKNIVNARYLSTGSMAAMEGTICKGLAKGDTSNGFPGTYQIEYFGPDGGSVGIFDWEIKQAGEGYRLFWKQTKAGSMIPVEEGTQVFEGFGFHNSEKSIVVAYWMTEPPSVFLGA